MILSSVPLHLVGPKIIKVRYRQNFTAASRGLRCYCTPLVTQRDTDEAVNRDVDTDNEHDEDVVRDGNDDEDNV